MPTWNVRCPEHLFFVTRATLAQQEAINVGYMERNGKAVVVGLYDLFGDIFPIILKDFVCSQLMTVSLAQTTLYTMYSVKSEKIFEVRRTSLRVSCLFSNGRIRRASEKGVVRLSIYGGSYFVSFPHIFIQTL